MINNLVIVESPAKAKTIEKFLGKDYKVKSSMGHIRDLSKEDLGIDINNNFNPRYIVPIDKKKTVAELKEAVKNAKIVWLASDEDREGEAIAWHLSEELKLDKENTRRIVFHEITEEAILHAIEHHRGIDQNLVNAQQARRVLDRLVGFEISPILWRKVRPSLSAGRVQSVAVRLIVDREREIINFKSTSSYRVTAVFEVSDKGKTTMLKAELDERFPDHKKALEFVEKCKGATFTIADVVKKPAKKSPSPPFTTSTLQQEASRKLGFSVSQTMTVAQHLYEAGLITYMRTDSVNLSNTALKASEEIITKEYGEDFVHSRNYKTKSKGAQEAHEAIRPAYLNKLFIDGNSTEKRLYELIWKRTVASQMSDARLEKTTVSIIVSGRTEKFIAEGEVLKFEGFLKVYLESSDDESEEKKGEVLLPPLETGMKLPYVSVIATEKFTHYPPRFTEASLVKKLEELGIGRPSTYAPTISTIQNRGYIIKEERPGKERRFGVIALEKGAVKESVGTEITGAEKGKLFPDNIGMLVNDFLVDHFAEILDFNFTASVEKEFDEIADGKANWTDMIKRFYAPFHQKVEATLAQKEVVKPERLLGMDPASGKQVFTRMARFGAVAQIGETTGEEKPRYAQLRKGQNIESLTLEEALDLFKLPRNLGIFEDKDVTVSTGRFGPYVLHNSKFYSLPKGVDDPYTIELDRAIALILEKQEKDRNKVISVFSEDKDISVLNGRWGPYISYKKENYKIPRNTDPKSLTHADCMKIIADTPVKKKKKK